jgi:hypothetical protein
MRAGPARQQPCLLGRRLDRQAGLVELSSTHWTPGSSATGSLTGFEPAVGRGDPMASEPTRHARGGDWLFNDQETNEAFASVDGPLTPTGNRPEQCNRKPCRSRLFWDGRGGFEPATSRVRRMRRRRIRRPKTSRNAGLRHPGRPNPIAANCDRCPRDWALDEFWCPIAAP